MLEVLGSNAPPLETPISVLDPDLSKYACNPYIVEPSIQDCNGQRIRDIIKPSIQDCNGEKIRDANELKNSENFWGNLFCTYFLHDYQLEK